MPEKAARWLRVSSGGQREESQEPDVDRWCASHGYEVVKTFRLHDVSAFHGEQVAAQEQAIADVKAGLYTVLVAWTGDRIERQGVEPLLRFMRLVREAGGRVEASNDPLVNSVEHLGELGPSLAGWMAREESKRKSDRIRIAMDTAARAGSHWGRHSWGLTTENGKFARHLVPTAEGREWIPLIFEHAVEGWSLSDIAAWLDDGGVKPKGIKNERNPRGKTGVWHPRSVGVILHNPVYAELGLVPWGVWQSAQAALGGRARRGRTSRANPKWLTGEAVWCAICGSPMNRKGSGPWYLRCERRARDDPQRRPCATPANMVEYETAVEMADAVLSGLGDFVYELVVVEGNTELRAALLADIERRARQAARLPFDQMLSIVRELEAERNAIPGLAPGRREARPVLAPDGEPETYGSWWRRMGTRERRDFLTDEIWVSFVNLGHAAAPAVLERLGPPDAAEGNVGMWWWYATEEAEQE